MKNRQEASKTPFFFLFVCVCACLFWCVRVCAPQRAVPVRSKCKFKTDVVQRSEGGWGARKRDGGGRQGWEIFSNFCLLRRGQCRLGASAALRRKSCKYNHGSTIAQSSTSVCVCVCVRVCVCVPQRAVPVRSKCKFKTDVVQRSEGGWGGAEEGRRRQAGMGDFQ